MNSTDMPHIEGLRLHHLGYATGSIEESVQVFSPLLMDQSPYLRFDDHEQGVIVQFHKLADDLLIEFVQPLDEKSPVSRFLESNRDGALHHIAYEHKDFDGALDEMQNSGFRRITRITRGFEDRKIAFFLTAKGSASPLIEIISLPGEGAS